MTDAPNICWHYVTDRYGKSEHKAACPICSTASDKAFVGRCRSGGRWFWRVSHWRPGQGLRQSAQPVGLATELMHEHGFAASEAEAWEGMREAVARLADGRPTKVFAHHGAVRHDLKLLNVAKRRAKPIAESSDANVVEYLYNADFHTSEMGPSAWLFCRFRIVRKTARRIFYNRDSKEWINEHGELTGRPRVPSPHDAIGSLDRSKIEREGSIYIDGSTWIGNQLWLSLEALVVKTHAYETMARPDLKQLKAAMVAAHPDKGGNHEAFVAARAAYEAARRMAGIA
jgi:hypothetical protein